MTDIVARAEAALEGITPGPWAVMSDGVTGDYPVTDSAGQYLGLCPDCGVRAGFDLPDAEFIAQAPTYVRELADEVKALREECEDHAMDAEAVYERESAKRRKAESERDQLADEVKRLREDCTIHLMKRHEVQAERDHWKKLWRGTMSDADQLRAAVDRVRSVVTDPSIRASTNGALVLADTILAALDGPGDE